MSLSLSDLMCDETLAPADVQEDLFQQTARAEDGDHQQEKKKKKKNKKLTGGTSIPFTPINLVIDLCRLIHAPEDAIDQYDAEMAAHAEIRHRLIPSICASIGTFLTRAMLPDWRFVEATLALSAARGRKSSLPIHGDLVFFFALFGRIVNCDSLLRGARFAASILDALENRCGYVMDMGPDWALKVLRTFDNLLEQLVAKSNRMAGIEISHRNADLLLGHVYLTLAQAAVLHEWGDNEATFNDKSVAVIFADTRLPLAETPCENVRLEDALTSVSDSHRRFVVPLLGHSFQTRDGDSVVTTNCLPLRLCVAAPLRLVPAMTVSTDPVFVQEAASATAQILSELAQALERDQ